MVSTVGYKMVSTIAPCLYLQIFINHVDGYSPVLLKWSIFRIFRAMLVFFNNKDLPDWGNRAAGFPVLSRKIFFGNN